MTTLTVGNRSGQRMAVWASLGTGVAVSVDQVRMVAAIGELARTAPAEIVVPLSVEASVWRER